MTQQQQQQQQQADSSAAEETATAVAAVAPVTTSSSFSAPPPEQASTTAEATPAPTANENNINSSNDNRNSAALFREIQYAVDSYYAIVKPVLLTMILAALAVVYIRTDESAAAGEEALTNSYTVLGGDDDDGGDSSSTARVVGESVVNAFVIVVVICALTFLIVLLYKYKFMKCLVGYMIVSSGMLLGFLASQMFAVAIDRYEWPIDKVTFGVLMYNFAVTGCVAIFAPSGAVPPAAAQGYLIATSVIVAWQLSHFSEILAWVLLVLLACYDLFAVLSPCGPLKALVRLMQRDDAPNMPGLLYEVSLPLAPRRARPENNATGNSTSTTTESATEQSEHNDVPVEPRSPSSAAHASITTTTTTGDDDHPSPVLMTPSSTPTTNTATVAPRSASLFSGSIQEHETSNDPNNDETAPNPPETTQEDPGTRTTTTIQAEDTTGRTVNDSNVELVTGRIPLALARLYKLRFVHDPQPYWITAAAAASNPEVNPAADSAALVDNNNNQNDSSQTYNYSPLELTALVEVLFSARGGRIVPTLTLPDAHDLYRQHSGSGETRYTVVDQHGQYRRVLFVNREGRIFEDLRVQNAREEIKERTSIKLGLGDFIFYSILVSKAALYSFTAFCACALAVVAGMGLTLCLLAVYGKALPALPISIALGVVFYLTTRFIAEPWVHAVFIEQVYV